MEKIQRLSIYDIKELLIPSFALCKDVKRYKIFAKDKIDYKSKKFLSTMAIFIHNKEIPFRIITSEYVGNMIVDIKGLVVEIEKSSFDDVTLDNIGIFYIN